MIPRSLDAIVGAAYHQSNSTQLNSNRYVLGQLTAPTARHLLLTARGLWPWCVPWGVPLARHKGGRGACLGGVRVREGWPRRVLSGPCAYLLTRRRTTRATTLSVRTTDQGRSVVESGHGLGSNAIEAARQSVFADPRCRTVRNGCKPLHAHSSCLGERVSRRA